MKFFNKTLLITAILATSLNVCAEEITLNQYDKLELQHKIDLLEKDLESLSLQVGSDKEFGTKQTDDNLKSIRELRNKINAVESIVRQLPNQSNFTQLESTFEKRLDDNQSNVLKRMDVTDSTFNFWGVLSGLFGVLITITLAALASLHFTSIKESERKVKKLVVDAEKEQVLALDKAVQKTIRQTNEAAQKWFKENAENKIEHYISQVQKSIDIKIAEIDETALSITKTNEKVKNHEVEARKTKEKLNKIITDDYSKLISKDKLSNSGEEQTAKSKDENIDLLKSAYSLYGKGRFSESLNFTDRWLSYQKTKEYSFNVLIMKASTLMELSKNREALTVILDTIKHIDENSNLVELMEKLKAYLLLTMCIYNLGESGEVIQAVDEYIAYVRNNSNNFNDLDETDKYNLSLTLRNLGLIYSKNNDHKIAEELLKDVFDILNTIQNKNEKIENYIIEAFSTHLNVIKENDMGRALSYASESLLSDNKEIALSALTFITHNLNEMKQYKNCSEIYLENIALVSGVDNILSDMCKLNGSVAIYKTNSDVDQIIDTISKLTEKYKNTERKEKYEWLVELDDFRTKLVNEDIFS